MRKQTMLIPNRSDTNRAVQAQKMARGWKFRTWKVDEFHYPCSKNKCADQLRSYCKADLRYCICTVYAKCLFSHDAAHIRIEMPI